MTRLMNLFNSEIHGGPAGVMYRRFIENIPRFSSEMNSFIRDSGTGKIVSSITAIPSQWSYDGILLQNLELGFVGTSDNYRNQGLFSVLYAYIDRLLKEQYDISSVQGIPYFYRKYGYDFILPLGPSIHLPVQKIPQLKPGQDSELMDIVIRTAESDDMNSLMLLLQESNQKQLVSTARSEELWQVQERLKLCIGVGGVSERFETFVLEKNGVIDGYIRIVERDESDEKSSTTRLTVIESSIRSYDSVRAPARCYFLEINIPMQQISWFRLDSAEDGETRGCGIHPLNA